MKYKNLKMYFAFDDVNECIFVMFISFDSVYAFSDVFSDDSEINPNEVICAEPLIVPGACVK